MCWSRFPFWWVVQAVPEIGIGIGIGLEVGAARNLKVVGSV